MSTKEIRNKQLCVSVTPTLYEKFRKIMFTQNISMNQRVNDLIEEYVADNQELIDAYDSVFAKVQSKQTKEK